MKKCQCCGHMNVDNATKCEKCFVALPCDEKKDKKPVKANKGKKESES